MQAMACYISIKKKMRDWGCINRTCWYASFRKEYFKHHSIAFNQYISTEKNTNNCPHWYCQSCQNFNDEENRKYLSLSILPAKHFFESIAVVKDLFENGSAYVWYISLMACATPCFGFKTKYICGHGPKKINPVCCNKNI